MPDNVTGAPISVVLAEDNKTLRKLICIQLAHADRIRLVEEAANGLEAVDLVLQHRPDILVTDIRMPGMSGIEVTRTVRVESRSTEVIVMSQHDDEAHVYEALAAGARGYVVKMRIDLLPEAIYSVSDKHPYLSPPLSLAQVGAYCLRTQKPILEIFG